MASDSEASCVADPNFAVICSFLEKFGTQCGITSPDFLELQEMLENTQELSEYLVDLHVKLMRKVKKSVSTDRWERVLIKVCHNYCSQDAWELERFGYKKARLSSKLRILKQLLEMQFDYNPKFKVEINKQTSNELRTEPIGRDKHGHSYWYQIDDHCEMRIYREDPDEETWDLVAKDREGLVRLITQLSSGDPSLGELTLNEDSNTNSLEIEKPITDTGQTSSSLEIDESSIGNEDSKESVTDPIPKDSSSSCDQIITPAVVKPPENAPSDLKITISTRQVDNKIETAIVLPKKEEHIANDKPQDEPSTKLEVGMDLSLPQSTSQPTRIVDLSSKKKKSINELAANLRFKSQDQLCNKIPVQEQEIDLSMKKNAMDPKQFSSLSVPPFEPISIESALQMTECPETEEELDEEEEDEDEDEEEEDDDEELDDSDEINLPSHMMKRPRLDRPTLLGNRKKKYSDDEEDDDEYGDEIEEPVMMIRGEGSGRECNNENLFNFDEVGEEIEEEMMFFYGEGSGNDCKTGNIKKDDSPSKKQDKASSSSGENTERNRAATMKDINEGMGKTISTNVKSVGNTLKCEQTDTESEVKSESNETPKQHKVGKIVIDIKSPQVSNTPSPIKKSRWDVGRPVDPHIFATPDSVPQKYDPKKLDNKLTASSNISINQFKNEIPVKKLFDTTINETNDEINNDNTACSSQLLKEDLNLTAKGNVQDLVSKWEQVSDEQKSTKNTPTESETDNTKQKETELSISRKPAMFFFGPGCLKINTPSVDEKRKNLVETKDEDKIDENCSEIVPKIKADKSINNLIHDTKNKTDLPAFLHTNISENATIKNKDEENCNNDKKLETVITKSNITVTDKTQIMEILPILTDAGSKSSKINHKENSAVAEVTKESPDKLEESKIVNSTDKVIEHSIKPDASIEIKEKDDSLNIEKSIDNAQSNELETNSILSDRKDDFDEISKPLLEENLNSHNETSDTAQVSSSKCEKSKDNIDTPLIKEVSKVENKSVDDNKSDNTQIDEEIESSSKILTEKHIEPEIVEESRIHIRDESIEELKIETVSSMPDKIDKTREETESTEKNIDTVLTPEVTSLEKREKEVKITNEQVDDVANSKTIIETLKDTEDNLEVCTKTTDTIADSKTITAKETQASTAEEEPINIDMEPVAVEQSVTKLSKETDEQDKSYIAIEESKTGHKKTDSGTILVEKHVCEPLEETGNEEDESIEETESVHMNTDSGTISNEEIGSKLDEPDRSYVASTEESKNVQIKSAPETISVEEQVKESEETENKDESYISVNSKIESLVDISERVDEASTEKKLEDISTTENKIAIEETVIVSDKKSPEVESELLSTAEEILPDSEHDKTVDELIVELQTEIKTAEQIKLTDESFVNPKIETVTTDKMPQSLISKESDTIVTESIEETKMETDDVPTLLIPESHLELSEPLTKQETETVSLTTETIKIVDESKTSTAEVSAEEIVSSTESKEMIDETVAEITSGEIDKHKEETVSVFESNVTSSEKQAELETEEPESEFDKHNEEDIVSKLEVTALKKQTEQLNIEESECESREQSTESFTTIETSNISSTAMVDQPIPEVSEEKHKLELSEIPSEDTTTKDIVSEPHPTESTPLQIEETQSSHDNKNDDTKLKEEVIQISLVEESQSLQIDKNDEPKSAEIENQISSSEDTQLLRNINLTIDAETAKRRYSKQDEISSSSIDESQPLRKDENSDLNIEFKSTTENICAETLVSSIEEMQVSQETKNNLNTDIKLTTDSKSEEIRIPSIDCLPLQKKKIEAESTTDSKSTVAVQISSFEQPPLKDKSINLNIESATETKSDEETQYLQENKEHKETSATESKSDEENSTTVIAENQVLLVAKSVTEETQVALLGEIQSSQKDEETRISSTDESQPLEKDKQGAKSTIESKLEEIQISSMVTSQDSQEVKSEEEIQISLIDESQPSHKDKHETKSEEDINITLMDKSQCSQKDKQDAKLTIEVKSEEKIQISSVAASHPVTNKDDSLSLNDNSTIAENHEEEMELTAEIPITACEINANSEQLDKSNTKTNKDIVVKVQSETKTISDINPIAESTDKILPSDISVENMHSVPEQTSEKVLPEPQTSKINTMETKLSKGELSEVETIVSKTIEEIKPSSEGDISENINISSNKDKKNVTCSQISENVTKESLDTPENPTEITPFVHGEDKLIPNDSINVGNDITTSENVVQSVNMHENSNKIKPMDDNNDKIAEMEEKSIIDHSSESNSISVDITTKLQLNESTTKENEKIHEPNDKLDTSKCKDSEIKMGKETVKDELNSTKKNNKQTEPKTENPVIIEINNLTKSDPKPVVEGTNKADKRKADESLNPSETKTKPAVLDKNDFKGFDSKESLLEPKKGLIKVKAFAIEKNTEDLFKSSDPKSVTQPLFPDKNPLQQVETPKTVIVDDIENEFSSDDDMGGCLVEFEDNSDQSDIEEITAPLIVKEKPNPVKKSDNIDDELNRNKDNSDVDIEQKKQYIVPKDFSKLKDDTIKKPINYLKDEVTIIKNKPGPKSSKLNKEAIVEKPKKDIENAAANSEISEVPVVKPVLICVDISTLKEKSPEKPATELKTRIGSPQVIDLVGEESNDIIDIPDSDPLAGAEIILPIKKIVESPKPAAKDFSLATFKLDDTDTSNTSLLPEPIARALRNRKISIEAVDNRKRGRVSEEISDTGGKKPRLRGKRPVDVKLRRSVEQKLAEAGSSSDDSAEQDISKTRLSKINVTPTRGTGKARRGRGRGTGRVESVPRLANNSPTVISDSQSDTSKTDDVIPTPPVIKTPSPRKKRARLLGLDIDPELLNATKNKTDGSIEECGRGSVRQSRRIAQIKIKEEAERRKIEEITLIEIKEDHKKKKHGRDDEKLSIKKKKSKMDSEDEYSSDDEVVEIDGGKAHKRKKHKDTGKLFNTSNPWQSSSGSSTPNEEEEDEEVEEEPSDEEAVMRSDHEFSPESDLETDEPQPLRRARTVKKESDTEDPTDEHACQKCGKADHPEWILLCDKCDCGWHCSCLRPALLVIPEGDWFCPPCQHTALIDALRNQLVEFDRLAKRKETEVRRKERLAYVGISLDNVLPLKEGGGEEAVQPLAPESGSDSSDSGSSSGSSSGDESEPIYQLRERRTAHSYRFNDYDELINSAIQDDIDHVKGAGNQGRGKDIATIVNAEKEEAQAFLEQQQLQQEQPLQEPVIELPPPVVPVYEEPPVAQPEQMEEDSEEELRVVPKHVGKKKHRKLNSLDISSEDDPVDDDDFKVTSASEEDELDELGSDDSDDMELGRRGKRGGPIRRSTRARTTRYDRDFINDNSDEEPRKKKTRSIWDDSESEESDKSWGKKKRVKKQRTSIPTPRSSNKKSRKKKKRQDDSDPEAYKNRKPKKPKIIFGGLNDSEDEVQTRRTRGKKINYIDALGSDTDEDKPVTKKLESEDEYVANEEDDEEAAVPIGNKDSDSESATENIAPPPLHVPKTVLMFKSPTRGRGRGKAGLHRPLHLLTPDPPLDTELRPLEVMPKNTPNIIVEKALAMDIPVIAANPDDLNEEEVGMMMENEEYAKKQLELMAIQLAKEKRRKELEAMQVAKVVPPLVIPLQPKKRGRKKKVDIEAAAAAALLAHEQNTIPMGMNTSLMSQSPGTPMTISPNLKHDDYSSTEVSPTVPTTIGDLTPSPPKRRGRGKAQTFTTAANSMNQKYFGGMPMDQPRGLPPGQFSPMGNRGRVPSPYRQSPPGMNLYPGVRSVAPNSPHRLRSPGPPNMSQMFHSTHHSLDPSPSGGGPINITNRDRSSPAIAPPASSPMGKDGPTPPPPPYSRGPLSGSRFAPGESSPGPSLPPTIRHHLSFPQSGTHLQQPSPPPRQPVPGNFSPYHPPPPPNYHYGAYPPAPSLAAADDALPPTDYQGSSYPEHFNTGEVAVHSSEGSNSKPFEEEGSGEFGGLVSYFSSQREDDLDT